MNENKRKKETKNENNEKRYICKLCDVGCRYKCDYTRHLLTRGHITKTNENNEKSRPFSCENCGKNTNNRRDYQGTKRNVKPNVSTMYPKYPKMYPMYPNPRCPK